VFKLDFEFTWWNFAVPSDFALGLSSFLVFVDFINEFAFQQFFRFGLPYILGRFIPADERRLIALYNSLDVDGDKNLSREELKKGMERLQRISLVEAKRGKGNHAANALKMASIMDDAYDELIKVDEQDASTKSSSGFTLPTLLKAYRASKRRHHKNKGMKVTPAPGGIDFDKLEDALGQVNELAFIVDNSPDDSGTSRDEMNLGMLIHGLRITKVVPNSQCELGGVAEGDVITKIGTYQDWASFGKTHGKTDEQISAINVELEEKVRKLLTEAKEKKEDITILLDTSARATSVFEKGKRHLRNGSASFKKAVAEKVKEEVDAADKQVQDATGLSALNGVDDNAINETTNAEDQGESDAVKATGPKLEYETYFFKGEDLTHEPIDKLKAVAGGALVVEAEEADAEEAEAEEPEAGSTKPTDPPKEDESRIDKLGTAYANFLKSTMKSFELFIDFADRMVTLGKITTFAVSYLCYTTALICYLLPTLVTFPSVIFVFVVTAWIWFGLYITFVVIVTLTTLLLLKRSPHLAQRWLSNEWWTWFKLPELTPLIAPHHMRKLFSRCIYYTANKEILVDGR
jgi:hypothetical protein